ncbi:hypothetical protein E2C01_097711 [Portunus trituberculatus]|uniref:Uncharacterized protein n=1 Tax=Portunus trituberculatus TaxID=210409 RepID=A0A5B7JZC9_PORTR|nr:hypothetical protein [Portunus trituberculatus]
MEKAKTERAWRTQLAAARTPLALSS